MERFGKKYKLILLVLGLVLLALFALALVLTRGVGGSRGTLGEHPLRISELMGRNTTVPNADGVLCDWIEIENTADTPFDVSGYKLSDDYSGAKYAFPVGSVIPAHGYIVVSCTEDYTGGLYAPFAISKNGGETVVLMNASNVVLDSVTTLPSRKNTVMVRASDGTLTLSASPTPGYPNTEAGYAAYMAAGSATNEAIRLSEIMSANTLYANADGRTCDWIEVSNSSAEPVDISGYMLSDTPGNYRFAFPAGTVLEGGGFIVVSCTEDYSGSLVAPFALSKNGGETVVLTDAMATVLDQTELPALRTNEVCARVDGAWTTLAYATPGFANTEAGYAAFIASRGYDSAGVCVSEAMASNGATLPDADGDFSDWIELHNDGAAAVDLGGWYLSDDEAESAKWRIPAGTVLDPGAYLVVFASGKDRTGGELHTDFSLSPGETALLSSPVGAVMSRLALSGCSQDVSAVLGEAGAAAYTPWATPGYANSAEGYEAFQSASARVSPLLITEVLVSNGKYRYQQGAGYSDIVELQNVSAQPIELSDYCLTDGSDEPAKWRLPAGTLESGARVLYYCSGDESLSAAGYTHTNFALNAAAETLFLYNATDGLCDWVWLHDIPANGSAGRLDGQNGWYYFPTATPGEANRNGARGVADEPASLGADGVFNDSGGVLVELQGTDTIYYTTDGSVPTAKSAVYTAPFSVTETCVVRALCIGEGKLPSDTLTLSYIINENHTLPVASLVSAPESLNSIYRNPFSGGEVAASISLYEADGSFTTDCGIKMYGHTALKLPKRSFKLMFRPRYGDGTLHYDVFDSDVTSFSSLVLRSGQDYPYAIFRDELFGSLCAEFTDSVLVQRFKPCILYLNGQYWGIYFFKEAFSEEFYAAEKDVDPASVTLLQAPVGPESEFREVINFALDNDLSKSANYEKFCEMVDIDSLIDWAIMEGYSANGDIQQNLRYFRSTENGNKWQFAFYDLDWAFYYTYNDFTKIFGGMEEASPIQHITYFKALLANAEFRDKFCKRLAEALDTTLSREHVLARIDELEALLAPEVARERDRWSDATSWTGRVQELRSFLIKNDWETMLIHAVANYCGLSRSERIAYFGK